MRLIFTLKSQDATYILVRRALDSAMIYDLKRLIVRARAVLKSVDTQRIIELWDLVQNNSPFDLILLDAFELAVLVVNNDLKAINLLAANLIEDIQKSQSEYSAVKKSKQEFHAKAEVEFIETKKHLQRSDKDKILELLLLVETRFIDPELWEIIYKKLKNLISKFRGGEKINLCASITKIMAEIEKAVSVAQSHGYYANITERAEIFKRGKKYYFPSFKEILLELDGLHLLKFLDLILVAPFDIKLIQNFNAQIKNFDQIDAVNEVADKIQEAMNGIYDSQQHFQKIMKDIADFPKKIASRLSSLKTSLQSIDHNQMLQFLDLIQGDLPFEPFLLEEFINTIAQVESKDFEKKNEVLRIFIPDAIQYIRENQDQLQDRAMEEIRKIGIPVFKTTEGLRLFSETDLRSRFNLDEINYFFAALQALPFDEIARLFSFARANSQVNNNFTFMDFFIFNKWIESTPAISGPYVSKLNIESFMGGFLIGKRFYPTICNEMFQVSRNISMGLSLIEKFTNQKSPPPSEKEFLITLTNNNWWKLEYFKKNCDPEKFIRLVNLRFCAKYATYYMSFPLAWAIKSFQSTLAIWLIVAGADVNLPEFLGETPLHLAATLNLVVVCQVLKQYGANLNAVDKAGNTPLLSIVNTVDSREAFVWLLQAGANVNARDKQNLTALHWAAKSGNVENVEALLKHGADPDMLVSEKIVFNMDDRQERQHTQNIPQGKLVTEEGTKWLDDLVPMQFRVNKEIKHFYEIHVIRPWDRFVIEADKEKIIKAEKEQEKIRSSGCAQAMIELTESELQFEKKVQELAAKKRDTPRKQLILTLELSPLEWAGLCQKKQDGLLDPYPILRGKGKKAKNDREENAIRKGEKIVKASKVSLDSATFSNAISNSEFETLLYFREHAEEKDLIKWVNSKYALNKGFKDKISPLIWSVQQAYHAMFDVLLELGAKPELEALELAHSIGMVKMVSALEKRRAKVNFLQEKMQKIIELFKSAKETPHIKINSSNKENSKLVDLTNFPDTASTSTSTNFDLLMSLDPITANPAPLKLIPITSPVENGLITNSVTSKNSNIQQNQAPKTSQFNGFFSLFTNYVKLPSKEAVNDDLIRWEVKK